ncbi:HAD hydrolase family protein, partial [Myceligenerans halotolerans]
AKVSHLHTDKQRLVAHNDLPMFRWAATAVAMAGAPAVVRAAADITTGTLEQHGAASILNAIAAGKLVTEPASRH